MYPAMIPAFAKSIPAASRMAQSGISKRTLLALLAGVLSLLLAANSAHAQSKVIYSETADAKADIKAALLKAKQQHKNVILDFGGNWCPDCQMLDIYFHDSVNAPLLEKNFELVHVNLGHYDRNTDVAAQYGVPLTSGVPALVVLNGKGKILLSQKNGEFRSMRKMQSTSVTEFLQTWAPKAS